MTKLNKFGLSTYDEIFGKENDNNSPFQEIFLSEIDSFAKHPFTVKDDAEMQQLVESVRNNGIIHPIIVREKADGRYECISGHRRRRACEILGYRTIRAEIREIDDDTAIIYMVDSNLRQREKLLPSEKAKAYEMKLEAMRRQAGRPSKNLDQIGPNLRTKRTREEIGGEMGDSGTQVQRYIRLNNLIPELMQCVDDGKLGFSPAVELSYLTVEQQGTLLTHMQNEKVKPSLEQAKQLKALAQSETGWEAEQMKSLLLTKKPEQKKKLQLDMGKIQKALPLDVEIDAAEDFVLEAIRFYASHLEETQKRH